MLVSTADFLDKLVLEHTDHPGVKHLLRDWLLRQMGISVVAELSLGVRTPRVGHAVDVTLVDAAVFGVHNARVAAQVLGLLCLSIAAPSLAGHAPLHGQTEAVLTVVLLETLGAASGRYHLGAGEEDRLLDLVVLPH